MGFGSFAAALTTNFTNGANFGELEFCNFVADFYELGFGSFAAGEVNYRFHRLYGFGGDGILQLRCGMNYEFYEWSEFWRIEFGSFAADLYELGFGRFAVGGDEFFLLRQVFVGVVVFWDTLINIKCGGWWWFGSGFQDLG